MAEKRLGSGTGSYEIDPFDCPLLTMVVMPANDIVLVCVWLLAYAIINYHNAITPLDFADMRLGDAPQIG